MNKKFNIRLSGMILRFVLTLMLVFAGLFSLRAQTLERDSINFARNSAADSAYVSNGSVKRTYATVKTNLLYDVATALNVEVEVPIAGRFSVMVEDVFPWWKIGNKYCLQMWEMGAEARFWFKSWNARSVEKMRGWFVGIYGMSSKYDFQYDRSINYQGEYWSAGLTSGYVMPVGRKKKINLEFSLSVGYLQTDYRHYLPDDDYSVLIRDPYNVGTISYFGPTKAKVSLIVPINFGKKGGAR